MSGLEILIPLIVLLVLIMIGVPVAFSMFIAGSFGLIWLIGYGPTAGLMPGIFYGKIADYILTTIPMFILMAEFLKAARLTEDLYVTMEAFVGHIRGGLAISTTLANGVMAALTGSSTATVASLASIAVPEMRKYGYDDRLSVGTVAAAGSFAIMIPPSLSLIIIGILTEQSIGNLFIAGIIPGALTVIGYACVILVWSTVNKSIDGEGKREASSWRERSNAVSTVWPALILIAVVLGGIYAGAMTPTEAGGVGAFGAFLLLVLFRDGELPDLIEASRDAVELSTMIFFILLGAYVFSAYLGAAGLTDLLLNTVIESPLPPIAVLLLVLAIYILLGTMMSQLAILVLTIPLTYPLLVNGFGYSPIWYGIVIVKTVEIGLVTPPLGLNIYVATSTIDVSASTAFDGAVKFLLADIVVLLTIIAFPGIVTLLL